MRRRTYRDYIQDIIDSIRDINSFIQGMSFEDFRNDKKTVNAVIRSIEVIGEATKRVHDDIRTKHSEIPWKKMAGMRNKMIHEYFGVDIEILWKTVKEDIPSLEPRILILLNNNLEYE